MADESKEKKGSMMKMLIIIGVVLLVDVVGGFLIGTKVIIPMLYDTEDVAAEQEEVEESGDAPAAPGIKHELEPININPRNSMGDILSIDIVLEATDQAVIDELTLRDIEIRDKLSSFLAFKSVDELNNQENWDGYKSEMIGIVNQSLSSGKLSALYIPSKIIQFQ